MTRQWYVRRGDQVRGPVSFEAIQALAARGQLKADDWIWPDEVGPEQAVPIRCVLKSSPLPGPAPAPDWLRDVKGMEQIGPKQVALPPAVGVPEWVEDLRHVGADAPIGPRYPPEPRPLLANTPPAPAPGLPDWVGELAPAAPPAAARQPVVDGSDLEIIELSAEEEAPTVELVELPPGKKANVPIARPILEAAEGLEIVEAEDAEGLEIVETEGVEGLEIVETEPAPAQNAVPPLARSRRPRPPRS